MSGSRGIDFKNQLDTLYKGIHATGEAFGREYDQKICELIPDFFDVEDLFDDEYLQDFAHTYTQEQIQNGVMGVSDLLDLEDDDVKAQLFALVQANFTKEEVFPEDKPIGISDSVSDAVGRQVEVLEAQNQALRFENQKLQQQLNAIKSLLHAN
jgi:hypothetical protein